MTILNERELKPAREAAKREADATQKAQTLAVERGRKFDVYGVTASQILFPGFVFVERFEPVPVQESLFS